MINASELIALITPNRSKSIEKLPCLADLIPRSITDGHGARAALCPGADGPLIKGLCLLVVSLGPDHLNFRIHTVALAQIDEQDARGTQPETEPLTIFQSLGKTERLRCRFHAFPGPVHGRQRIVDVDHDLLLTESLDEHQLVRLRLGLHHLAAATTL